LTLKGKEALERADVVVYDLLANPELLALAPPGAQRINAGKRAGRHVLTQAETNALLVRLARQGKRVVRLKGGDPFVFGRGGEEALALAQAGQDFEVVPGVSSGVAVPAYAGIPVTHRGLATGVVFVTGQERTGRPLKSRTLRTLARLDATLVFFMATESAARIAAGLIRAGKPASTPAACVMNGTRPDQRSLLSTLGRLAADMQAGGFAAPALLIVGSVVALRPALRWFEKRPLFGRRYVVTRSREQASKLSEGLRALGAEVWELPAIEIKPLPGGKNFKRARAALPRLDWAVFSSVNGVEHFFRLLFAAGGDARDLQGLRLAAVGRSTAEALAARGLRADLVPSNFDAEHLLKALLPRLRRRGPRRGVLLVRAREGRDVLLRGLRAAGQRVEDLPVYRTVAARSQAEAVAEAIEAGRVDGVTFTSSSTVAHFRGLFSLARWRRLVPHIRGLCLGPITRASAEAAGVNVVLQAREASLSALLEGLRRLDGHG
jgi:uroporphyrinogen III methyltransferase/synthase